MKRQLATLFVISVLMLTACGANTPTQPTATLAPTMSPTATLSPTFTPTPEPTFTSTATPTPRLPVSIGTKIPNSDLTLSADNLDKITELARWGKGVITDATYSPDGKLIAIATTLGVTLYQTDTLNEILDFETGASVNSLAFSPDGGTIATSLSGNIVKLWKASDGTLLKSIDGHHAEKLPKYVAKAEVTSVSFSPDGSKLAGGSADGTVSLWQVADGSLVNTLKNHTDKVTSVFFSPDGQYLFSASWDNTVRMIQVSDGKSLRRFSVLGGTIYGAALSADGKILAAYEGGNLTLWNVEDGIKITKIDVDFSLGEITSIALSPDGQYIAAGLENHTAKIWSVNGNVLQSTFEDLQPKEGKFYYSDFAVAFSPDGGSMLIAGSNVLGIWDIKKGALLNSAKIKSESIYAIALSPDKQTLASVEGTNVYLWQISDGSSVSLKDAIQTNGDVAFSADGASLSTSLFDNTARIWPLSEQGVRHSFEMEKKDYISGIAFSPDGKFLALGTGYPGKIELRQVEDGALIRSIKFSTNYYYLSGVAFSTNGDFLAAVDYDKIVLFQVSDGKTVKSFKAGFGLAFSPDNTLLAGGGKDKMLQVWKIPSGEPLFAVKDQPENVDSVVFSPDGTLLVSGSEDGTIQVFRVSDGSLLKKWKGHSRWISDLLFSSDGKLLISSSADGTIRVWGIKP